MFGAKSAFDTWDVNAIDLDDPHPCSAQVKKFLILPHPDHLYQQASVAVTKFPGRPFLLFGGETLKMFNTQSKRNVYNEEPRNFSLDDKDGQMEFRKVHLIWVDGCDLYMVCNYEREHSHIKTTESYLVRF